MDGPRLRNLSGQALFIQQSGHLRIDHATQCTVILFVCLPVVHKDFKEILSDTLLKSKYDFVNLSVCDTPRGL